jgi:AmpD protein
MKDREYAIDGRTGILHGATVLLSSHCDMRPAGIEIDLLVIHAVSLPPGEFDTSDVIDLFMGSLNPTAQPGYDELATSRVSAHFLVSREGQIFQCVSIMERAWHAGLSVFGGREQVNDFSVGIELIGSDACAFTNHQYDSLCQLTKAIMSICPGITLDRIVGHSDIAPGRKTDPGPQFDWKRYFASVGS